MSTASIMPVAQKFVQAKKEEKDKRPKYPRYHNDTLRNIISDLKIENASLRKRIEIFESMYRKLEKEYNEYKMGIFAVRELDILGDDYYINNPDQMEVTN